LTGLSVKNPALYNILQMNPVQPGSYLMGSSPGEQTRYRNEPQREVTLSRHFELGSFPVTNLIWSLVMEVSLEGEPLLPKPGVSGASWYDAVDFCRRLNELVGLPQAMTQDDKDEWVLDLNSPGFRLPTEAEWEYACRAGTTEATYGPLDDIAWHSDNSGKAFKPVGLKLPNQWGFYDTLGNVWEWCWDWYRERPNSLVTESSLTNPWRVVRGGARDVAPIDVRAARRSGSRPNSRFNYGFRLARSLEF